MAQVKSSTSEQEGQDTFIAEEPQATIGDAPDLGSYPSRQHIEGSPRMCEVLVSKEGPLALKPAILAISIYWPILHAANVVCSTKRPPLNACAPVCAPTVHNINMHMRHPRENVSCLLLDTRAVAPHHHAWPSIALWPASGVAGAGKHHHQPAATILTPSV